jgi:NAD(P)H-dependent FMN reductase
MNRVTLLCGSRKPAPGLDRRSSARELLQAVRVGLADREVAPAELDLRDLDLPQFDGRTVADYASADLDRVHKVLAETDVLVVSVPAYWNAASGPLVNLCNVLGGASYDLDPGTTLPLDGTLVVLLVVGADSASAYHGAAQIRLVFSAMGAWVAPREVVIGNPREVPDLRRVARQLRELGQYAATVARP